MNIVVIFKNTVIMYYMRCGYIFHTIYILTLTLYCDAEYSVRITRNGKVRGIVENVDFLHGHKRVEKFFGVPYASPPIGNLRLEPPVPPPSWNHILDTQDLPPACPQPTEGVAYIEYHVPGFNKTSENCLYLNIYVPKGTHHHRAMPVLFFVHGGSYQNGMGAMFDGSVLAAHGIVVVTFNYRLGPLGFISSADDVIRGNYGMLDMIAALQWVQNNIAHFNGDPNHVTIDGHSAGGCSVGLLLMSPLAKGLFRQVIQQSGSPLAHWAVTRHQTKPNFIYNIFTSSVQCHYNSSQETKRCLQRLDSDTLEKIIMEEFEWSTSLTPQYRPVVDGHFLPRTPEELVKTGKLNADTIMTGVTQDEGLIAAIPLIKLFGVGKTGFRKLLSLMSCFRGDLPEVTGIVDSVLAQYIKVGSSDISEDEIEHSFSEIVGDYFITAPTHLFAERLSQHNISVYLYNYEYKSVLEQWDGVIHGAELFYLSGCPFTGHKNFRYNDVDKKMAKILLLIWSNFIKHGVPSLYPYSGVSLSRFYSQTKTYARILSIGEPTVAIASNLRQDKMSFWNEKIPKMFQEQFRHQRYDAINYRGEQIDSHYFSYQHDKSTWILTSVCIGLSVLTVVLTIAYYKMRKEVSRLLRQNSVSSGERMLPPMSKIDL